MKKFLLLAVFVLVAAFNSMVAQPTVFFGAGVGANFSTFKFKSFKDEYVFNYYQGKEYDSKSLGGFQGGLRVGVQFGETVTLFAEPSFFKKKTSMGTKELTREDVAKLDPTNKIYIDPLKEGYRTWTMGFSAIHIPVMVRVKLFGDKFGMHAQTGLSYNYYISGSYNTEFRENGTTSVVQDNPLRALADWQTGAIGHVNYSEQYPNGGLPLSLGKKEVDNYSNSGIDLILGTGLFYKLDDDGKFKLTLDWRWDFGLTNMYQKARIDYLATVTGQAKGLDVSTANSNWTFNKRQTQISGTQKMNSGILTLGVEFCPSCGF